MAARSKTASTAGFISGMVILMAMSSICQAAAPRETYWCYSAPSRCFRQYIRIFQSNRYPTINIDGFCSQTANIKKDCIGWHCMEATKQSEFYALILAYDYVCDPVRRNEMQFLVAESSCLRDALLETHIQQGLYSCVEWVTPNIEEQFAGVFGGGRNRSADRGDVCPAINTIIACNLNKLRQRCGPIVMPLAKDLVQIVLDHVMSLYLPSCQVVVQPVVDDQTIATVV